MEHYKVSAELLTQLFEKVDELFLISVFLCDEYRNTGFRGEVISDGCSCNINQLHRDIRNIIYVIANDGKLKL